jgi:hypothetical protein
MVVAAGDGAEDEDDEEPEGWAGVRAPRAVPKPKTKQQRARKLKLLEEVMPSILVTLPLLLITALETRSGAEDREQADARVSDLGQVSPQEPREGAGRTRADPPRA